MNTAGLLLEGERLDDLQRNGLQIIQNEKLFCFGMDAVLLSAFAQAGENDRVLDLGCGNGIIPLLLWGRGKGKSITGMEIQKSAADMATRSVRLNGLEEHINIICADLREADRYFPAASFDIVTSNPPYMIADHGEKSPTDEKAIARHEVCCTMKDVARAAARMLKSGGHFYLVHRPFRLAEIIRELSAFHLEPKRMQLVYPFIDREPNLVLLEAVRGGRPRMKVEPPLIVYEKPGVYTEQLRMWYE